MVNYCLYIILVYVENEYPHQLFEYLPLPWQAVYNLNLGSNGSAAVGKRPSLPFVLCL